MKVNGGICPFCEGNEHHTPGEISAIREPDSEANRKGWRVRVIPNKFPALEIEGDLGRQSDGLYDMMQGIGAHEVIIESPRHLSSTSELSEAEFSEVLCVYRNRLVELKKDHRLAYGMIFKNVGPSAGASLEHLHSQLIATPIVPINVWEEMTGSLEFYNYRGRCVYCDILQRELANKKRIILETSEFVALCPFASRFAFETWILPKTHSSRYENIDNAGTTELAGVLKKVIKKLEDVLEQPAYNYIIHTSPFDSSEVGHYHWHIEIMPRINKAAGFEWGTGFYINPVPPEDAATALRTD
jgi:UDPglucose--hexose-1-phosphate uridylyltransferase